MPDRAAEIERVAVADPGQVVFLRLLRPCSPEQMIALGEQVRASAAKAGITILVLPHDLEVAKIEDGDDA